MNELKIENKGYPLSVEDLNFLMAAYKDAFEGIARTFGNAFLYDCRVGGTGSNGSIAHGFVALGGEIYRVSAQSWTTATITDPCLAPFQEADTNLSPVEYDDLIARDAHFVRMARVEQFQSLPGQVRFRDMKDFGFYFLGEGWVEVGSSGAYRPIYSINWGAYTPSIPYMEGFETLKVRKYESFLELTGVCQQTSFVDYRQKVFQLPDVPLHRDGQRLIPTHRQIVDVPLAKFQGGSVGYGGRATLEFDTDGGVYIEAWKGGDIVATDTVILCFNHRIPLF
ncbi:MAG: hypothetical protein M9892_04695 [Bacteroidetes bacterium]|nr:hypothetical protein [Bacteroidota bacterium]